ncbi:MAG: hypothetical protein IPO09_11335 [Anaeromyxobacter sp.]|nr:hypothetical protein [Anaeromyxobacter sp.]MBL0276848.1 hypothetical protein [Anaeromyxobacter sp.]
MSALALLLALSGAACARSDASGAATAPALPAAGASHAATGQLPRLIFFMNPNGPPCQMQDQILQGMASSLQGRAEVVYYRTTDGNDLQRFQQYGVRSLPLLVVTDASGRELRRATPGIQSPPQVMSLLAP